MLSSQAKPLFPEVLPPGWAVLCVLLTCLPTSALAQTVLVSALPDGPSSMSWNPGQSAPVQQDHGRITGLIVDPQGALIPGAQLHLSGGDGTVSLTSTTAADGTFLFADVAPGAFTLSVTIAGFDTGSAVGSLLPGQHLEMKPVTLRLATAHFVVDAVVSTEELSEIDLRIEETQRLVGFLPNFFVTYNWKAPPLTASQKFRLAFKNASDPGNLVLVGLVAGVQQADNAFSGYGQGAAGYGRRYGADLGNLVVGTMMGGAVLPTLFHQDPRYFYKGTGSIRSRALYAVSSAVICRGDNGRRQPAFASVLGDLSAGAISNIYYPASDRNGAALTIENGFLGIAGDALNNVFQEFVLRRLTPKIGKPIP